MPVHSEFRQPRISSSSASARSSCTRSFTCLLQPLLDRVAVDPAVLEIELVDEVLDLVDRLPRHEPERRRLATAAVLLARVDLCEASVGRDDRASVLHRRAGPLAPEHLEDHRAHAASASTVRETQSISARESLRNAIRSADAGPFPETTAISFPQSGSVYVHVPSSARASFGSGSVRPSSHTWGTYPSRNCWRASSLGWLLIRQCTIGSSSAEIGLPWNIMSGSHQRSSASWTSSRCPSVPVTSVSTTSRPWRMWNDSSQQIFRMIRAYGA